MVIENWEDVIEEAKQELGTWNDFTEVVEKAKDILRDDAKFNHAMYLKSPRWKQLRLKILERDDYKCQDCLGRLQHLLKKLHFIPFPLNYKRKAVQVHHLDYGYLLTEEEEHHCISLCSNCHKLRHTGWGPDKIKLEIENQLLIGILYEIINKTGFIKNVTEDHKKNIELITIKPEDWLKEGENEKEILNEEFDRQLEGKEKGKIYGMYDKTTGELVGTKLHTGIDLEEVHKTYNKYYHVEDSKRIDIVLAVALSQKLDGIPLWLILVGPSGDMKSVQLNSLKSDNVMIMHNLTSKTLVNGYRDKTKFPDLAPELNNKIVVIPDMAQILKLPPNEKGELWGQLRDLYDGLAGKMSGMGSRAKYEDLKITLLAGSTPSIDGQILVHQDLGTRELIFRTKGNKLKKDVMKKCFDNEELESKMKKEINEKTTKFLESRQVIRKFIKPEYINELMEMAIYITYMRATAEFDSFHNELRNEVYPEEPTRISKQLKRFYTCLINLADDYPEERALSILWEVARSSAFPLRIKIFERLLNNSSEELSTSGLSEILHIGKSTVKRECSVLWNMGLLTCRKQITNSYNPDRTYDFWKINKVHPFIIKLKGKPSPNI